MTDEEKDAEREKLKKQITEEVTATITATVTEAVLNRLGLTQYGRPIYVGVTRGDGFGE